MLSPKWVNAGNGIHLEEKRKKGNIFLRKTEKRKNWENEKMKNMKKRRKKEKAASKRYLPRRLKTISFFFVRNVIRNREAIKANQSGFDHPRKQKKREKQKEKSKKIRKQQKKEQRAVPL